MLIRLSFTIILLLSLNLFADELIVNQDRIDRISRDQDIIHQHESVLDNGKKHISALFLELNTAYKSGDQYRIRKVLYNTETSIEDLLAYFYDQDQRLEYHRMDLFDLLINSQLKQSGSEETVDDDMLNKHIKGMYDRLLSQSQSDNIKNKVDAMWATKGLLQGLKGKLAEFPISPYRSASGLHEKHLIILLGRVLLDDESKVYEAIKEMVKTTKEQYQNEEDHDSVGLLIRSVQSVFMPEGDGSALR